MNLKTAINTLATFATENEQDEERFLLLDLQSLASYFRGKKEAYLIVIDILKIIKGGEK